MLMEIGMSFNVYMPNILSRISKWIGSIWIYCRTKAPWHQRVIRLVDQLKARDRLKCRKTTGLP